MICQEKSLVLINNIKQFPVTDSHQMSPNSKSTYTIIELEADTYLHLGGC